jgi:hypothetical protein
VRINRSQNFSKNLENIFPIRKIVYVRAPTTIFEGSILRICSVFVLSQDLRKRKGASGGGKIRTVRSQVGHGMSSGWVAGPMKSRDTVYLRSTRGSSEKLAASGMCLGPKDPEEHNGWINHGVVRLHEAERKKKRLT